MREDFGRVSAPPAGDLGVGCADGSFIAHRQLVTAAGPPPGQHGAPVLGFHALTESMHFGTLTVIRLKCTLRHLVALFLISRG